MPHTQVFLPTTDTKYLNQVRTQKVARGAAGLSLLPPNQKVKKTDFVDRTMSVVLRDFTLEPNLATEIGC